MDILVYLDDIMYYPILIIVLSVAGLIFTLSTRFVQIRLLGESIRVVMERPHTPGAVSSFQALMVSTASRVGTGNIIGVSTAICLGGPGAVFWMWLLAIIGGASAFVESTLAQIYKRRGAKGTSYGGPAYYIETAMGNRTLGVIFAFFLILTYAGGFNMLASFNLQSTFAVYGFYHEGTTPWLIGGILALLVGYCISGGGSRIIQYRQYYRCLDGYLSRRPWRSLLDVALSHHRRCQCFCGKYVSPDLQTARCERDELRWPGLLY